MYCRDNPINAIDPDGKAVKIWYKDKNGNYQTFYFDGTQNRCPDNSYVKDFIKAYNYLNYTGGGDNLRTVVKESKYMIYVSPSCYGYTHYSSGDRQPTVYWESRKGLLFRDGGKQSPATQLEHEFDHAKDDQDNHKAHNNRRRQPDSQYDNKEERRVTEGSETKTALLNHESTRKDHKGIPINVISPISIKLKR